MVFRYAERSTLNLAPLYGLPGMGGSRSDPGYWSDKPENLTGISGRMEELVVGANEVYKWRTPIVARLSRGLPKARFAIMDIHALITDIHNKLELYLNGTTPTNVTGTFKGCNLDGHYCQASTSPDSFLWYDSLHPSEQTDRIIARNLLDVVYGRSKYAR